VRYFLVDRIEELKPLAYAVGVKCVSLSEDCFDEHFPGQPVYPGSLLVEAMAQLGGALLELGLRDAAGRCPRCVMSSVKAKFRDFVRPGDTVVMRAEVQSRHDDAAVVRVSGRRGEQLVCEAEVLYVLLTIDDPRLQASRNDFLDVITRTTRMIP
jgi:3-hydroxyacyl-[acyl-carrier-protein] dehydratase